MYDKEKLKELYIENIKKEIRENIIEEIIRDDYVEFTIRFKDRKIEGIKIDKEKVDRFKEYKWNIKKTYKKKKEEDKEKNKYKHKKDPPLIYEGKYNICTYKKYDIPLGEIRGSERGKPLTVVLFREEVEKIEKEKSEKYITYINGDKLDNRRKNIIFVNREEQAIYKNKNTEKLIGVNECKLKFGDISYEVKIRKSGEDIYLTKTACKEKAVVGRYLLEIIFFGKSFIETKLDKHKEQILLNLKSYKNKEKTIDDINKFLTEIKLDEDLVDRLLKKIENHTNLIY